MLAFSGGEELWVFVDKTLVVQIFADPSETDVPCRSISLANAGTTKFVMIVMLSGSKLEALVFFLLHENDP